MTDETRDDATPEQDEGDVEAHSRLKGATQEPGDDFRGESDDDVEAHSRLKGAIAEPGDDFRGESDDDVEGHMKMKGAPKL
jgi:hypothetical protein